MAEKELTAAQQQKLAKIAKDFQNSMKKLGLGVTISVPGRDPVVITEPPEETK
jgi:hypothetical protein